MLPQPVTLSGEATRLGPEAARFARLAVERNAFTVVAHISADDVLQDGPARIITFSRDQFNRNFDLGQERRRIVLRVRTPTAGPNGNSPRTETVDVLQARKDVVVAGSFDGAVARVYVEGQLSGRSNLAAAGCIFPSLCDADLPLARGTLGAALAIIALAIFRRGGRRMQLVVSLLGAGTGVAILRLTHLAISPLAFDPWTDLLPLAGGACIAATLTGKAPRRRPRLGTEAD